MKKILPLFFFFTFFSAAHAFTLVQYPQIFSLDEVPINVDNVSSCAAVNTTHGEILDLLKEAMDRFWNQVPTASLKIKKGGLTSTDTSNADPNLIIPNVPTNTILVGCNSAYFAAIPGGDTGIIAVGTNAQNSSGG